MLTKNIIFKITLALVFINANAFSCPIYENPIPIADAYVSVDAKKSKTSWPEEISSAEGFP